MEFRDLKKQYQVLKDKIDEAMKQVAGDGNYISGKQVEILEKSLADYVGVKHCISCANGTDALSMVLDAWGVKKGDAVFVPDFTFFATAEVVSFQGATPVFVDVDADTFNMDPIKLEASIEKVIDEGILNPKAVICVDLFGLPADFKKIDRIANRYSLLVLEDGAQGFGGMMDGRRACGFGDAATTSFFPAKPLGCYGDGGAVFTNDDSTADYLRSIRVHGKGSFKYDNVRIGRNSRLDTMQAAILLVKFDAFRLYELKDINIVAQCYTKLLQGVVATPVIPNGFVSSWAQYTIKLDTKEKRDGLQASLKSEGIPSMVYYPKPMHNQQAFSDLKYDGSCPVTESLCDTVLSLPMHPYLTKDQVNHITTTIKNIMVK